MSYDDEDDSYFLDGHIGSLPKETTLAVLRSPEQMPSSGIIGFACGASPDLAEVIEVRNENGKRLGAIVMRARGDAKSGRLGPVGLAVFSVEEIEYARNETHDAGVQAQNPAQRPEERAEGHVS